MNAPAPGARPTATVTASDRLHRTVTVEHCPTGCWLVLGEGFHESWSARTDDGSLGPPQLVDGGFNGWWIPPHDSPITVHIAWTAQRPLGVALAVSLAMVVMAVVIVIADRRRTTAPQRSRRRPGCSSAPSDGIVRSAIAARPGSSAPALFVTPGYAVWGLLGGVAVVLTRRVRLAGVVAIGAMAYIAYTWSTRCAPSTPTPRRCSPADSRSSTTSACSPPSAWPSRWRRGLGVGGCDEHGHRLAEVEQAW